VKSPRLAVVLFNLGGPDAPAAVEPFLYNLFRDPAIIRLPQPLRGAVAWLVARRRAPVARAIYDRLGGRSPLLAETERQAAALAAALRARGLDAGVFVAMRYWHPMSETAAQAVLAFAPDMVVLLPLYPQYSTTTTASSLAEWQRAAAAVGLDRPTRALCCYPEEPGFIAEITGRVLEQLNRAPADVPLRLLFSAHGLPKRVVASGDPYPWQVELTAAAVVKALGLRPGLEHVVCYQSRVGPLAWIGPSTEEELARAARDGRGVIVVPIAFVSEHSETLVELDIDYRDRASEMGVPAYLRAATVGAGPAFIDGLARLVTEALGRTERVIPPELPRLCPAGLARCPCRVPASLRPSPDRRD
jgi:ferrochelatase